MTKEKSKVRMHEYRVGQRFSGIVLQNDGARLDMMESGDVSMIVQCRKPNIAEICSLAEGFNHYSYGEVAGQVTLGAWVFQFPAPLSYFDAPFHVGLYPDRRAERFLEMEWNALVVFFLDGAIIQNMTMFGLHFKAVDMFKSTIRRQLNETVNRSSYDAAVANLFRLSPEQIFRSSHVFKHCERS